MTAATAIKHDPSGSTSPEAHAGLDARLDDLRAWNISSEAVYLAAGNELQLLYRRVMTVRDCIRRATEIMSKGKADEVEANLRAAAAQALSAQNLAVERGAALERLSDAARSAAAGSSEVALVFRLLDYVVLVARTHIEAMTDARDELGPFTHHVQELVESGQRIARDLDERVRLLLNSIHESRAVATELQFAADSEGGDIAGQFDKLLAQLDEQRAGADVVRDGAQASFQKIGEAVAGLVAGLQFHDIARQRMEHSLDNLARLKLLAREGRLAPDGETLDPALRGAAVNRIARLEMAQLASLARLYEDKMGHIQSVLGVIDKEVEASDQLLASMFASGSGQNAGRSAIAVLEAEAARVRARFQRGEKNRQRLNDTLAACVEAAHPLIGMTDELAELEHALRLAGFNAAVRAAHVDSGDDTIGYISREIRDQASIAKDKADDVRSGIEVAVAATNELGQRILPAIAAAEDGVSAAFAGASGTLGAIEGECLEQLREGASTANGLGGLVSAITKLMTPHVKGCAMMLSVGASLAGLSAANAEDGGADPAAVDAILDELGKSYTMVEERDIFVEVFGRLPASAKGTAAPAPASDDLDDILF